MPLHSIWIYSTRYLIHAKQCVIKAAQKKRKRKRKEKEIKLETKGEKRV
jgi:hypothetical protein